MDTASLIKKYVTNLSYENLQDMYLRMSGNFSGDYFRVFKKFESDEVMNGILLSVDNRNEFYSLLDNISNTLKKEYEFRKKNK